MDQQKTDHLGGSKLQQIWLVQAASMCVSSARDLADLIFENKGPDNEMLPEWWWTVFCMTSLTAPHSCSLRMTDRTTDIYTCATIFLAAHLCLHLEEYVSTASLQESWEKRFTSLKIYQTRSRSAQRCLQVLELIDQRIHGMRAGKQALRFVLSHCWFQEFVTSSDKSQDQVGTRRIQRAWSTRALATHRATKPMRAMLEASPLESMIPGGDRQLQIPLGRQVRPTSSHRIRSRLTRAIRMSDSLIQHPRLVLTSMTLGLTGCNIRWIWNG